MITGLLTVASMMLVSARTTLSVPASEKKSPVHKYSGTGLFAINKTNIVEEKDLTKVYSINKNQPGNLSQLPAVPPAADAAIGNIIDPSGAPVCSASIYMHNFAYEEVGQRDTYRTPKIDVGTLDSVVVFFSVAYQQYEGTADSLLVLYSPDCGITWLPTGYAKGGEGLSSSPGTTG